MENSEKKEKILKIAKICKIVSKVAYVLTCAACLVFIVLSIVLPNLITIKGLTKTEFTLLFVGLAVSSFFLIGTLWNVEQIFVSIERDNSPFSASVTRYIRKTAIFLIIQSIVPELIQGILTAIFTNNSDLYTPIQLGGIICGIVLYLLGIFFDYGDELKKKEDETL